MGKDRTLLVDLGQLKGTEEFKYEIIEQCTKSAECHRQVPLRPEQFAAALEGKSFESANERMLVAALHAIAFTETLGHVKALNYEQRGWGDVGVEQLSGLISSGALRNVEKIGLSSNQIGDTGVVVLSRALREQPEALPQLRELKLGRNSIGEQGMRALASVLHECPEAVAAIRHIWLAGNPADDTPVREALEQRHIKR